MRFSNCVMRCSLHSLVFEVKEVYALFLEKEKGDYPLSEVHLMTILNLLLSGNYRFSPLSIDFECSDSGSVLTLTASPADELVISGLGALLVKELRHSCYFRDSCFSSYRSNQSARHYLETIQKWSEIEALLLINCWNSITRFPRSILIEKVQAIVNYDSELVKLISSFCNLAVLDYTGEEWSDKTGVPPLLFISEILFNIFLDEIDREIEEQLPNIKYARYEFEILVPIFHKEKLHSTMDALSEIFNKYNFRQPKLYTALRGEKPIPFAAGFIHINCEGNPIIILSN